MNTRQHHAAEPWHVHKTRTHFHIRNAEHEIALVRNVTDGKPGWSSEADAVLIAASPKLLKYLRLAAHLIGRLDGMNVRTIDDGEGDVWDTIEVAGQFDACIAEATEVE